MIIMTLWKNKLYSIEIGLRKCYWTLKTFLMNETALLLEQPV